MRLLIVAATELELAPLVTRLTPASEAPPRPDNTFSAAENRRLMIRDNWLCVLVKRFIRSIN